MNMLLASHILIGQNKHEPDSVPGFGKGQALVLLSAPFTLSVTLTVEWVFLSAFRALREPSGNLWSAACRL